MKATLVTPPPPPDAVTLTMSLEQAQVLYDLSTMNISIPELASNRKCLDYRVVETLINQIRYALEEVL